MRQLTNPEPRFAVLDGQRHSHWGSRWEEFWFAPARPDNLALCRILFYGSIFLFYTLLSRFGDFAAWGGVSDTFWVPTWFFGRLGIHDLPPAVLLGLEEIWKTTLALSCLGLFTRLSTAVSCLLGFYLLGLPQNFGKIHHFDAFLVFALLIMALSRCGDHWSIDELLSRGPYKADWQGSRQAPATIESGEYTWPVQAMWLVMSLVFFAAGIAKLRHSGLTWVTSDSMEIWLIQHQYHVANAEPLTHWGPYIARVRGLPHLLAACSMALELGYPLAMLSKRARWIFVPGVALMQLSIQALMGPSFDQQIICNLFWVPWDRVFDFVRTLARRGGSTRANADVRATNLS